MTPRTARVLFLAVATFCFVVAYLLTANLLLHGSNPSAWGYAGLGAFALSFLVEFA